MSTLRRGGGGRRLRLMRKEARSDGFFKSDPHVIRNVRPHPGQTGAVNFAKIFLQ
jgi:hypothetical protein